MTDATPPTLISESETPGSETLTFFPVPPEPAPAVVAAFFEFEHDPTNNTATTAKQSELAHANAPPFGITHAARP